MGRADKILGIVIFLIFGGAFLYARSFPPRAATYVNVVNLLGMLLAACLVVTSFINDLLKKADSPLKKIPKQAWIRMGIITAAIITYAIIIRFAGYILSTIFFAASTIIYLYLGERNKLHYISTAIVSISVALILYFVFGTLLYIPLP